MHRIRRLTLLVILALPAAPIGQSHGLPAPESVFSFRPGADYKLATYDQSISYFLKLINNWFNIICRTQLRAIDQAKKGSLAEAIVNRLRLNFMPSSHAPTDYP